MDSSVHYIKIFPKKIIIHKSFIYTVHPLDKFRVALYRNSEQCGLMKDWVYAGNHNGNIEIQSNALQMVVESKQRINYFSLKLFQIKYNLQKETRLSISCSDEQEIVGKHIFIAKKYIFKSKSNNMHFFEQQAKFSTQFTLFYQVFVEKTLQGLDQIIFQHERLQNRHRINSGTETVRSQTFSDKINEIEVEGENRISPHATFVSPHALHGSQSKLNEMEFSSPTLHLRKHKKIKRPINTSLQLKLSALIMTDRGRQPRLQQQQQNEQEVINTPEFKLMGLKKLSSYEVKIDHQMFSPIKLKRKKLPLISERIVNLESKEDKNRILMDQFQRLKRKINQEKEKETEKVLPRSSTERKLNRNNSTKSMKTVRLIEWEKLPDEKPWVKKQKEKAKLRNRKVMFVFLFLMMILLYFVMQPIKNLQEMKTNADQDEGPKIVIKRKIKEGKKRISLKKLH